MSNGVSNSNVSRRSVIKLGGMALIGVCSQRPVAAATSPQISRGNATEKPIFFAPDTADPAAHSKAENLFWCDVMMEHAAFFVMLMPGADLATQRAQAENFQRSFENQYNRAKTAAFDRTNYAAFNRSTVELLKPFAEYKHRMGEAQTSGKIRSFVFPMFFQHTAREAERAANRFEKLSKGQSGLDFSEVVDFWSSCMSDHTEFIAHFLDPEEQDLISQAFDSSAVFKGFNQGNQETKLPGGEILLATEELIDFQKTVEEGIDGGRIKGILHPTLVDHMRRETLKFVDEIKRTASKT